MSMKWPPRVWRPDAGKERLDVGAASPPRIGLASAPGGTSHRKGKGWMWERRPRREVKNIGASAGIAHSRRNGIDAAQQRVELNLAFRFIQHIIAVTP